MTRFISFGVMGLLLAGCAASTVPDSGAGAGSGVGFGNYADYQARREAELIGNAQGTAVPPPAGVVSSNLDNPDPAIAAAERALGQAPGGAITPAGEAPRSVSNAAGISDENNFDAVSGERDIAADAELIARNRAQYQVIQPTALPSRSGSEGPNIVEYAITTSNARGTPVYSRTFPSESKAARACADYSSADLAQEAFLAAGGPQRDRRGMDPDGDGFACSWDPAPFRNVLRGN